MSTAVGSLISRHGLVQSRVQLAPAIVPSSSLSRADCGAGLTVEGWGLDELDANMITARAPSSTSTAIANSNG